VAFLRALIAALIILRPACLAAAVEETDAAFWGLFEPCAGDCALAIYAGSYVENSMNKVLISEPELPFTWDYGSEDRFAGIALSRRVGTLWSRVDVEPEIGFGRRFGRQEGVYEVWAAVYGRYRGFPWDKYVETSLALSTGLNWATELTDVEVERAQDDTGAQLHHFFSPEITFALPKHPEVELLFRFHHRSGVVGLINNAGGGSQYGTVGLRWRF
jgi:hypothetical protein